MGIKIKSNDDRIKITASALLLITWEKLNRNDTDELIASALAEYRAEGKSRLPKASELAPISNPVFAAYHKNLTTRLDTILKRFEKNSTQFNSLVELDNYLVFHLKPVTSDGVRGNPTP